MLGCVCIHCCVLLSYMYLFFTVEELLREEARDRAMINAMNACRKSKNAYKKKVTTSSGGVFGLMTMSGFLIALSEILHVESPTECIIRIYESLTCNDVHINYFNRYVEVLGYDMMCNIVCRLLSQPMRKMMENDDMVKHILFFFHQLGLQRLFADKMHIQTHVSPMCQNNETGALHPKLDKFRGILNDIPTKMNEQVAEQLWVFLNKLKCIRKTIREKFQFSLFMKRQHHNHLNKLRLQKHLYRWESISNFKNLRHYIKNTKAINFHETKLPKIEVLHEKGIDNHVQRERYDWDTTHKYKNIFADDGECFPIDNDAKQIYSKINEHKKHLQETKCFNKENLKNWIKYKSRIEDEKLKIYAPFIEQIINR